MHLDLLESLINQQRQKVYQMAQNRIPWITPEDLLNPHDFPLLATDPLFNYEEGVLTGLLSAQIAFQRIDKENKKT